MMGMSWSLLLCLTLSSVSCKREVRVLPVDLIPVAIGKDVKVGEPLSPEYEGYYIVSPTLLRMLYKKARMEQDGSDTNDIVE